MDNQCSCYFSFNLRDSNKPQLKFYEDVDAYLKSKGINFISFYKPLKSPISLPVESMVTFYFNVKDKVTTETPSVLFTIKGYVLEIANDRSETIIDLVLCGHGGVSPKEFGNWLIDNCIPYNIRYTDPD